MAAAAPAEKDKVMAKAVIATFVWSDTSEGRTWDQSDSLKLSMHADGTWTSEAMYNRQEADGMFGGTDTNVYNTTGTWSSDSKIEAKKDIKGTIITFTLQSVHKKSHSSGNGGTENKQETTEMDESSTLKAGEDGSIDGYYPETNKWVSLAMDS